MSTEAFDIVIAGAGSAGCAVAAYLAEHTDASIALIEAGSESDLNAIVEAVKAVRQVMAQQSLALVIEEELEPGPGIQSDVEIAEWAKQIVTTMWHPVGTCRMGQDERSIVDARLRVCGVDGLRVIDASIMPNITSGNTNAPTQALARHASAMLVEDLQGN